MAVIETKVYLKLEEGHEHYGTSGKGNQALVEAAFGDISAALTPSLINTVGEYEEPTPLLLDEIKKAGPKLRVMDADIEYFGTVLPVGPIEIDMPESEFSGEDLVKRIERVFAKYLRNAGVLAVNIHSGTRPLA